MFNCFQISHIIVLYNLVYVLYIITFSPNKIFTKDLKIIIKLSDNGKRIIKKLKTNKNTSHKVRRIIFFDSCRETSAKKNKQNI